LAFPKLQIEAQRIETMNHSMISIANVIVEKKEKEDQKAVMESKSSNLDDFDYQNEPFSNIDSLSAFVLSCLHSGRTSNESFRETCFLVPDGLFHFLAREIKSLSGVEPYGVRGCVLSFGFRDPRLKKCYRLGRYAFDPSIVSTFEISLCFQEDVIFRNLWSKRTLTRLFRPFGALLMRSRKEDAPAAAATVTAAYSGSLVISKEVEIVKKRFYRSTR